MSDNIICPIDLNEVKIIGSYVAKDNQPALDFAVVDPIIVSEIIEPRKSLILQKMGGIKDE